VVIPGVEISTREGHLIALNVTDEIPQSLSLQETVEKIEEANGIPIVPHLFRNMSGIKTANLKKIQDHLSSIEVFNGCSLPSTNLKTARIAQNYHYGGTGGSDAHEPTFAGYGYTIVNTTDLSIDAVVSELQKRATWGEGVTIPLNIRQDRMVHSIKQFFQRGLRRI
jgi:predicted metal-dependent phosphoesterase TrpH